MKKYKVNVNGTAYEITLEVVDEKEVASAPAAPAAPAPAAAPAAAAPAAAPAGAETVKSPMPGTILAVNVTAGQSVKKGDVLVVLEAMKMDNDITAPCDGVVSFPVASGANVDTDAVLAVIG